MICQCGRSPASMCIPPSVGGVSWSRCWGGPSSMPARMVPRPWRAIRVPRLPTSPPRRPSTARRRCSASRLRDRPAAPAGSSQELDASLHDAGGVRATTLMKGRDPAGPAGTTYRLRLRTSSHKSAQISRTASDCHRTTASAIRPAATRRRSQRQAPLGLSPPRSCSIRSPSSVEAADRV